MKEHKKTTYDVKECKKTTYDVGSLLAFFHLCCVSVPFSDPSLNEIQFYRNFFPVFAFDVGSLLAFFLSALFCTFLGPSLNETKFCRNVFP